MADDLSAREHALRRLPLPYSLALRLRDAGVAAELVCQYLDIEAVALDGLYRIAEAKLLAAQQLTGNKTPDHRHGGGGNARSGAPAWRSTDSEDAV
jgi:hypothetical protein